MVSRDESRQRRFLVVGVYQIVLVEPDATRLGWGVATFVGFLQVIHDFIPFVMKTSKRLNVKIES